MSAGESKAVVRRFVDEVQGAGNVDAVDELCSPEFVNHSAPPNRGGVKQRTAMFRRAFPDSYFTVEDAVAEGDRVVTRKTFHGAHGGELMGIPPTGRRASMGLIDIVRVSAGQGGGALVRGRQPRHDAAARHRPSPGDTQGSSPAE